MERSGSQSRSGSTAKGYVTKAKNYIAHNYTLGIGVENATDFVGVSVPRYIELSWNTRGFLLHSI